jgi:hypothetical protein
MNKSKRYNKSKRVKRFRKTKKGGSWLNGLFGIFKSRNAQKMEPNASKVPPSTVSPSTVSTQPLNKPVVSNILPKK